LLDKTHIFIRIGENDPEKEKKKEDNRKFSAIIALAISLTAVFMHVRGTQSQALISLIHKTLQYQE
jgi:hypothetical protein